MKQITIITAVVFLFSTTACKKILDITPYDGITEAMAFSTSAKIESAMNGVYDAAQSGFYAGNLVRGYPFGAANIEQGDMRGEDMVNDQAFYQITYESSYNSTSANQQFMFETLYALINKANLAIEGITEAVKKSIISDAVGKRYMGECRFLRALAHHELLIHYARPFADANGSKLGIIYREFGINSDASIALAKQLKRTTVSENYQKIVQDLDFAEANLPSDAISTAVKTFRATKAAAIALKMRVKLHKGDWAGVVVEGNKLIPSAITPLLPTSIVSPIGSWSLQSDPHGPFIPPFQSSENIFSIKNAPTDNPGENGALANMLSNPAAGGRGLVKVGPIVYNLPEWKCDDKRRTFLTVNADNGNHYTTKYKDPLTSADAAPQIRYSEVLLTQAEAEARIASGTSLRAIDLLNTVRNRSLATPNTQQYVSGDFASKTALIRAILIERRIEFLAEGKRWGDIHRLVLDTDFATGGIPAKIGTGGTAGKPTSFSCGAGGTTYTTSLAAVPYSNFKFIWPIPLSETQQNPNYEQNPGY